MSVFGLSDAEYLAWLSRPDLPRCLLVEATFMPVTGGSAQVRYLSNRGYTTRPNETPANVWYDDRIVSYPAFYAELSSALYGRSTFGVGNLVLDNSDGALDGWLEDGWDGQPVSLWLGSPDWKRADFRKILSGVVADVIVTERNRLALQLRDKTAALNVPVQTALVGGSTANANQVKPLCFGQCFNVEPVLVDSSAHRYQVHDGQINAISQVRDNGVSVAFTASLTTGTFTLNAAPSGRITADVQGAAPGGIYLTSAAYIARHLILTRSNLTADDIDAASFTAHAALCPQTLGLYVKDRRNLVDCIDELLSSVGGWWSPDRRGLLRLGRLDEPAGMPVDELTEDDIIAGQVAQTRRELPAASIRLGYAKNWTVQTDGLAGAVTEANRALYAAECQVAAVVQSLPQHALATNPDVVQTLLVNSADAMAEAARRAALRSRVRSVTRITAFARPLYLRMGDVVRLTHPRFGFDNGPLAVVVRASDQVLNNRVELDLWR